MGFDRASLYARLGALKRDLAQKGLLVYWYGLQSGNYGLSFIKNFFSQARIHKKGSKEGRLILPPFQLQPVSGNISQHTLTRLHQQVAIRWLAANIITGISGGLLMTIALYVPMQGQTSFGEFPKFINRMGFFSSLFERKEEIAPKANRLSEASPSDTVRHVFKSSIATKVGNREVTKTRTLVRLITPLSTPGSSQKIPSFNSKAFLTQSKISGTKSTAPEPPMEKEDEDITFASHKLPIIHGISMWETSPSFSEAQIFHQVVQASTPSPGHTKPASPQEELANTLTVPIQSPKKASDYTLRQSDTQYPILDTQILPENVTVRLKNNETQNTIAKVVVIHVGDNLEKILKANNTSSETIKDILQALGGQKTLRQLTEGDRVEILLESPPGGGTQTPTRVTIFDEDGELYAMAALDDKKGFVSVVLSEQELQAAQNQTSITQHMSEEGKNNRSSRTPLYNSVYTTVMNNSMPPSFIGDLVRIFASNLDFQKPISGRKTLDILYSEAEAGPDGRPEILYANFGIGNEHFQVYRYISPKDRSVTYYNPQGQSVRKFLLRKPLAEGSLSSGFGMRSHPILRYKRMHTGVDWLSPMRTPILAAADGVVARASWAGGYGRRIELTHRNGYTTTYSHLSAMAKGIKPGVHVRQGQVIGYLGSSGLSTGPHLHYEVLINGHFMDPMKVKLPQGQTTENSLPSDFSVQKAKIDTLLRSSGKNQPKIAKKSKV